MRKRSCIGTHGSRTLKETLASVLELDSVNSGSPELPAGSFSVTPAFTLQLQLLADSVSFPANLQELMHLKRI